MMDGRVAAIRTGLDENGLSDTPIMSYAVKYASGFYGPFREAAQSAPKQGDRRGYELDPTHDPAGPPWARRADGQGALTAVVKHPPGLLHETAWGKPTS